MKNALYGSGIMPKKVQPASPFGEKLHALRTARGLTQTELAEAIQSSQRAISHYETVADFPPAPVIVALAKALRVSADELLGIEQSKAGRDDAEQRRLWKKFRRFLELSEKDRRAIVRMISSLGAAKVERRRQA